MPLAPAKFELTSHRLHLRPCGGDDLADLHRLWTEPDVRRFLFDDRQLSIAEAEAFVTDSGANFERYGYGLWIFAATDRQPMVGFTALVVAEEGAPSLIFGADPGCWRQGYTTEAAAAVLRYAAAELGLPRVVADVDEPNTASIRVLEKLGMRRVRRAVVNDLPLLYYEIDLRTDEQ